MVYESTIKRAERVLAIVRQHYEAGRQDRCLKWVWREHIYPELGLSYIGFQTILHRNGYYVNERRCRPNEEQLATAERLQLRLDIWEEEEDEE